jgi:hypothetical protein
LDGIIASPQPLKRAGFYPVAGRSETLQQNPAASFIVANRLSAF